MPRQPPNGHKTVDGVKHLTYLRKMRTDDLDAIGLLCPLPVLKLRKRLMPLAVGDCIRLRADDPAAIIDVPHFCAETGHELVETAQDGSVQIYLVRKGG